MRRMWSPWRAAHLRSVSEEANEVISEGSVFGKLVAEDKDEENLILWRGKSVFVILNRYPYNNGHLLILPYRPVSNYEDLTAEEQTEMAQTVGKCIGWLKESMHPDGFNVGMNLGIAGGAGIPQHLHMHVVPRWKSDTNFMPAVAGVKVVPESLDDTYRHLRRCVDRECQAVEERD